MGNGEAKELTCMTHGHELKWGNVGGKGCAGWRGVKGGNGTTGIASSIKYIFKKCPPKNKSFLHLTFMVTP